MKYFCRTVLSSWGTSNSVINYILGSMLAVCKEEIYDQIKNFDFLATQCD